MEFKEGDSIEGQYLVERRHRGGMGLVYIVQDGFSGKRFAVKTIRDEYLADGPAVARFAQEARTWMRLGQHENIVEAVIYREVDGQPLLFLEYVAGTDLQELLDREKALSIPQALDFARQICRGMSYVHTKDLAEGQRGVIHRDLKPLNLLVNRSKVLKITDFGLARVFGDVTRLTPTGTGMGTYAYVSPEQFSDAGDVAEPSDVYSFGVILYRMLTGKLPITGRNVGNLIHNIMTVAPQAPRSVNLDIPPALSDYVLRCLHKQVAERFGSFGEAGSQLETLARRLADSAACFRIGHVCERCGYHTLGPHPECLVCGGRLGPAEQSRAIPAPEPLAPAGPETTPAKAERAEPAEPAPDPAAAGRHVERGVSLFQQGKLKEARRELREALQCDPSHVKGAQGLRDIEQRLRDQREARRAATQTLDWTTFGGNPTRNRFTPEVIHPPLVEEWQVQLGDWVWSSPAVAGDRVFVGSRIDAEGRFGRLCALNAATGQILWEQRTGYEVNSSPTAALGVVYVGFAQSLVAFWGLSGEVRWQVRANNVVPGAPAVLGNVVVFGSTDRRVYAVESRTGRLIWTHATEGEVLASPTAWDNVVYVGSADHYLYAIALRSGQLLWRLKTGGEVLSSPAVHGDALYVGCSDGNVSAVDRLRGKLLWRFQTEGEVQASPAVCRGVVYVGSRDGALYALDAETGRPRWRFASGDWLYASPAVADEVVYAASCDKHLYALDADTGEAIWQSAVSAEVRSSPAIAHGRLYVGTNDGRLYAFGQG